MPEEKKFELKSSDNESARELAKDMEFVIEKKMELDIRGKFTKALVNAKNKKPPEPPREIKVGEKMRNNINERLAKTEKKEKNKPGYQYLSKNEKLEEVAPTSHTQNEI